MKKQLLNILLLFVLTFSYGQSVLPPNLLSPSNNAPNRDVSIRLDWAVTINNQGYIVEIDTNQNFNTGAFQTVTTSNSNQNFTHLRFGTTYYWRVATVGLSGNSAWAPTWSFTTTDQVNLASPANNSTIQSVNPVIVWSNILGNTDYIFEVDTVQTFNSNLLISSTTSASDVREPTGALRFGTQYYWRVAATTVGDTSQWSIVRTFFTSDQINLSTPANGSIDRDVTETLNWSSFAGITEYLFQVDTNSTFNSPLLFNRNSTSSFSASSVSNLRFGTTYYWRVAAVNSADTSMWSSFFTFTTLDQANLISPSNGSIDREVTQVLNWSSVSGNSGYLYQVDTIQSFNSPALVNGTSSTNSSNASINNLRFGTTYYWRVAIKNAVDTSMWSNAFSFTTIDQAILNSPPNGSTNRSVSETIDWISTSGNTGYIYQVDTIPTFNSADLVNGTSSTNFSQATVINLRYGTTYYWRAAIKNATDTSMWSSTFSFTTIDKPILVSPSNGNTIYRDNTTLDWLNLQGSTGYLYQLDTTTSFNSNLLLSASRNASSSQTSVSNLRFGTSYYWRVASFNGVDTSEWSLMGNFNTLDQLILTSPSNGATNQFSRLDLDWTGFIGQTGFIYELDTNSNFNSPLFENGSVSNTSQVTISNLRYGTSYFWRVAAINSTDTSDWSAIRNFTTLDQVNLVSPANNSINRGVSTNLNWSSTTGRTAYLYQINISPSFNSTNLISDTTAPSSSQIRINFLYGTKYYWRVAVKNAVDTSNWSATWNFTTLYQLGTPTLVSPANGAMLNPFINSVFDWDTLNNSNSYEIQISELSDISSLFLSNSTSITQDNLGPFTPNNTYYWRVRARNSLGASPWSVTRSFVANLGVGLTEVENSKIELFPNPTSDYFTIKSEKEILLRIYSLDGKLVRQEKITNQSSKIDVSNLNSGIYSLIIESDTNQFVTKLIKK